MEQSTSDPRRTPTIEVFLGTWSTPSCKAAYMTQAEVIAYYGRTPAIIFTAEEVNCCFGLPSGISRRDVYAPPIGYRRRY
jgi:hypothetical protein